MKITRRRFWTAIAGLAALTAIGLPRGAAFVTTRRILAVIETAFGPEIAATPAAKAFAQAYLEAMPENGPDNSVLNDAAFALSVFFRQPRYTERGLFNGVVNAFARSTNVVSRSDESQELEFVLLFDPYLNPCSNQLSVFFDPNG